jgi:chemotaxis receptor (MCP) glutamine deamidase CheD
MDVSMCTYKKALNPDSLTAHLGSCVGVSIYNKLSKIGFLGNFVSDMTDSDSMLIEACNFGTSNLEAVLAGGSISDDMSLEEVGIVLNNREHLYASLRKVGISDNQILMRFADKNTVTDMTLYTSTGFMEVYYENLHF